MPTVDKKKEEVEFGQLAIALGFLKREELDRALAFQAETKTDTGITRLGEICIKKKILHRRDVLLILRAQGKRILCCSPCGKSYNVPLFRRDREYKCKHCDTPLRLPWEPVTARVNGELSQAETKVLQYSAMGGDLKSLLPGYEITERIGQGGMGTVYKVRDLILKRWVAVKILSPLLADSEQFVGRFFQEAKIAKKMRHPNIVETYDAGVAGPHKFFLMEFVDGPSMDKVIREEGRLKERRALDITCQAALGLAHAWKKKIVHRDVKPANIMIARGDVVKLCDMGLSKDTSSDISLTLTGHLHCSPQYASPEQCKGDRNCDSRSDSYSLGVTLFHMLTGRLPFKGDTAGALIIQHVTAPAPDPRKYNSKITSETAALVLHMIRKKPFDRPYPAEVVNRVSKMLES